MKKYKYTYKVVLLKGRLKDCYYYGQHSTNNLNDGYICSSKLVNEYFKKYESIEGETYSREILSFYDTIEELDKAEETIIGDKWKTDDMCLNLIKGGRQASIDEASHKKMSDKAKKRVSPMKGKHHTKEAKEKNRQKHLGKTHPSYCGWNHTEESIQKITKGAKDRKYVNNGIELKCVKLNELDSYLNAGWKLGTGGFIKIDYSDERNNKISKSSKNHHWINNGIEQTHVSENNIQEYLDNGWQLGCLKKNKNIAA